MYRLRNVFATALAALPMVSAYGAKCNVSISAPSLLTELSVNQTIAPPSNPTLIAVTLGVGTQNYTCQSSEWVNVGAVASLFDISCLQPVAPIAAVLPAAAEALQTQDSTSLFRTIFALAQLAQFKLFDHYFDTSIGPNSPVFNAAVSGGGFFIGKKIGDIPSPSNPTVDVDWLMLSNVSGTEANFVVRELTAGGQPPQSKCSVENEALQVPYSAKYLFYLNE